LGGARPRDPNAIGMSRETPPRPLRHSGAPTLSVDFSPPKSDENALTSHFFFFTILHVCARALDLTQTSFVPSLRVGAHGEIGHRRSMEDATYVSEEPSKSGETVFAFYGMFDGHGGCAASDFVSKRLARNIAETCVEAESCSHDGRAVERITAEALQNNMVDAYFRTDREFRDAASKDDAASGTTALVVCVCVDLRKKASELIVANCGDCRAVLSRVGKAIDLSTDQRPNCSTELVRIQNAGGFVEDGYINGHLGVARAFGNFHVAGLKGTEANPGPLTVEPQVERWGLTREDEFLVIACDGLWDVFSSNNAVDFARRALRNHNDPKRAARELCDEAVRRESVDNVSVIVVCFSEDPPPDKTTRSFDRVAPPMGRAISTEGLSELQKALRSDDEAAAEKRLTSPHSGLGKKSGLTRVASINPSSPSLGHASGLSGFSEFASGLESAVIGGMTTLAEESSPGLGESV